MKTNFRKFVTASGKLLLAGKDAQSNEALVKQASQAELVLHTKAPGSPFVNIKSNKPDKDDIKEAAIFCAKYSQAWKKCKVKKDILIHIFLGKNIHKTKEMKTGMFSVSKFKEIKVRKEDIEKFKEEK